LLEEAMTSGSLFGTIQCSDMLQGNAELNGYFAYDEEWNWLIFAVKKGEIASSYRTYGEQITIKKGLQRAQSYNIVDSAYVLDALYFYEYGVEEEYIGRKISKIDLKTNKNLDEIFAVNLDGYVEYALKDHNTGLVHEQLAYIMLTEDKKHVVVVEADLLSYENLLEEILFKIRFMTFVAMGALMMILYLLYQNFVILIDPITEQSGGHI